MGTYFLVIVAERIQTTPTSWTTFLERLRRAKKLRGLLSGKLQSYRVSKSSYNSSTSAGQVMHSSNSMRLTHNRYKQTVITNTSHTNSNFIGDLGIKDINPEVLQLSKILQESLPSEPILLIASPGNDPSSELKELARGRDYVDVKTKGGWKWS